MSSSNKKYFNFFEQTDKIDGINVKIDTVGDAIKAVKEMFTKPPNIVYGIDHTIDDYKKIIIEFRKWLITNKIDMPIDKKKLVKQIFEFHFKTTQDHIVAFQSHNLDFALLMCKINKKFLNIEIPKIKGGPANISFIATYTL